MHAAFGSEAKLECAVSNPMVECKWYKNGILLEGTTTLTDGCTRSLYFPSVSHDNEGEYECKFGNESSKARVEVIGMHMLFHKEKDTRILIVLVFNFIGAAYPYYKISFSGK